MPLTAEVIARIPNQRLVNLTNDLPGATVINATILANAAADTEADLETCAGVAYDDNDPRLVAAGVRGVILYLLSYKGESRYEVKLTEWRQFLTDKLRLVTGNNRVRPRSSSRLTPAEEAPGGTIVRPWFDGEVGFGDLIPDPPPESDSGIGPRGGR